MGFKLETKPEYVYDVDFDMRLGSHYYYHFAQENIKEAT